MFNLNFTICPAQSANIKLVSGASETYKGFTGSLKNALKKAANDQ
jgi:uncharacterized protein with FMN-binding domain